MRSAEIDCFLAEDQHGMGPLHQPETKNISKNLVVLQNQITIFQKATGKTASVPEESYTPPGSEAQNRSPNAHRQGYVELGPGEITF